MYVKANKAQKAARQELRAHYNPPSSSPVTTIIFDLEGVVVDTEHLWDEATEKFVASFGLAYSKDAVKPRITGKTLTESTAQLQKIYDLKGTIAELVAARKKITAQVFSGRHRFVGGFQEFHSAVKEIFKTGVATSLDRELFALLDKDLGITGLFNGNVFLSEEAGMFSKPSPAIFLHAASALGASPVECVVVEDSPLGVRAAKDAGMKCVALTTTFHRNRLSAADLVASSFADIDLRRLR